MILLLTDVDFSEPKVDSGLKEKSGKAACSDGSLAKIIKPYQMALSSTYATLDPRTFVPSKKGLLTETCKNKPIILTYVPG